jgi:hypothetical protein
MTRLFARRSFLAISLGAILTMAGALTSQPPVALAAAPMIMAAPSTVPIGGSALITGSGFTSNGMALVAWQRPDGTRRSIQVDAGPGGMFSFRLQFAVVHGVGTELVRAVDRQSGMQTPTIRIQVIVTPVPGSAHLTATPNPVMIGHTTLIIGQGFAPGTVVLVRWLRPDGSMNAIQVLTNNMGTLAFRVFADPRFGCGARTFSAVDLNTGMQATQLVLAETC